MYNRGLYEELKALAKYEVEREEKRGIPKSEIVERERGLSRIMLTVQREGNSDERWWQMHQPFFSSMVSFCAYGAGNSSCEGICKQVNVLCESEIPCLVKVGLQGWQLDIQVALHTLFAFYEAREQLPWGTANWLCNWLANQVYHAEGSAEHAKTHRYGKQVLELLLSCIEVEESLWLMKLLEYDGVRCDVLPVDRLPGYRDGFLTARLAKLISGDPVHFNAFNDLFEARAREYVVRYFIRQYIPDRNLCERFLGDLNEMEKPSTVSGALVKLPPGMIHEQLGLSEGGPASLPE